MNRKQFSDFYVGAIREFLKDGNSVKETAKHFNTSERTIARIRDMEKPYDFCVVACKY